jgi:nucleotide-binding universal stress UspA family protein
MSWTQHAAAPGRPPCVVVGVAGRPHGHRLALEFAAEEANRRGGALRIVHGLRAEAAPTGSDTLSSAAAARHRGQRLLAAAADVVRPLLHQAVDLEQVLSPVTAAEALLAEAQGAALVVLQRRHSSVLGDGLGGSTTSTVAARADCPVAVLRAEGNPWRRSGTVVVGVGGVSPVRSVLELAAQEATLRGTVLTAVHAWSSQPTGSRYGRFAGASGVVEDARQRSLGVLAGALAVYAEDYPQLLVHRRLLDAPPTAALLHAAEEAQLLVLGRPWRGGQDQVGLGWVARHCLSWAPCPVVVVPASVSVGPQRRPNDRVDCTPCS